MYHGKDILKGEINVNKHRSKVGMVFQNFNLFNNKTVLENCVIGQVKVLKRHRKEAIEIAKKYLEKVGMLKFANVSSVQLSGGQKQRVAIASAILAGKSVLIFDEPTSGLDYRHMVQTALLFRTLQQRKITTFIITHDPELIQRCCTHVFHIENGQKKEFYEIFNQGQ